MKKYFKTEYMYFFCMILFFVFYFSLKVKPRLSSLNLDGLNAEDYTLYSKKDLLDFNLTDRRINIGDTVAFRDRTHWYQVYFLSFWRKEYLNLNIIKKSLLVDDLNIQAANSSNYALGNFDNEQIVFACLNSTNNFYYNIGHYSVPRANDLNYWQKVFINNIENVIYKFKPNNYYCLLIFTSNRNFFENSEEDKRESIFNKFVYSLEK